MVNLYIVFFLAFIQLALISSLIIPLNSSPKEEASSSLNSFLAIDMERNNQNVPNIKVALGSNGVNIGLYISTTDNKLYLANYNYQESITYRTQEEMTLLDPIKKGLKGRFAEDLMIVSGINIPQFNFVHILDSDINYYYKGRLGLGYNFPKDGNSNDDVKFSFLYQLKSIGAIDKYIVSISHGGNSKLLYIGQYPENFPSNRNQFNYKTCPLIDRGIYGGPNRLWQCTLNVIFFNDYSVYKVNLPSSFSLGGSTMNVSKDFFRHLVDKYFKMALDRNECYLESTGFDINCGRIDNVDLKELTLVFGKWSLRINKDQLFSAQNNHHVFLIRHQPENFPSEWTLPLNIFANSRYQPVFDGERKEFGMILN